MNEQDWDLHRRANLRHRPRPWELVRVMLGYAGVLCWVLLISVAVGVYDCTLVRVYRWPMLTIQCVQTFFGAITFALTLLLVFKTNASYNRWSDARRALGMLTSTAHNLARQAVAIFPPHQAHLTSAMLRWTAASMWAVKAMVRSRSPLQEELRGVLLPCELSWLLGQQHKPLAVGQALSSILQATDLDVQTKASVDRTITTFTYEFGSCNRIYNTAIPAAYTRHTSRFLMCYIMIGLPLLMWPLAGWGAPILSVAISALVLGIEQISAFIEEPFTVLAVDAFCHAVTRDVQTVLAMMGSTTDCALRRPLLMLGSRAPQAPVIAGLTAPYTADRAAAATPFDSSAVPHQNPFLGLDKSPASIGDLYQVGAADSVANGSAGTEVGNSSLDLDDVVRAMFADQAAVPTAAATVPLPAALSSGAHQFGQLHAAPVTPISLRAESPARLEASPSWGSQQLQQRVGGLRRSFDVGSATGSWQRRPVQPVNSRTSLLVSNSRHNLPSTAVGSSAAL